MPVLPVFNCLPDVEISVYETHEEWYSINGGNQVTPAVNRLVLYRETHRCPQPYGTPIPPPVDRQHTADHVLY